MPPPIEIERPAPRRYRIPAGTVTFIGGMVVGAVLAVLILASVPPSSF